MTIFKGFGPKAMPFLKALDFHQNRDWFKDNKALYESELNGPRGDLIEELTARFETAGLPFKGDRKKSVYRINRDVRFSNDKRPYNRHVSVILTPSGEKRTDGCLYIHFGLEECFMGIAFYSPEPDALRRMRISIVEWPERYRDMLKALKKGGLALSDEDSLKRNPRGFETVSDPDLVAGVRNRHFFVRQGFDPARACEPGFADDCADFARRGLPLITWGMPQLAA